jgi:hypothetical protein
MIPAQSGYKAVSIFRGRTAARAARQAAARAAASAGTIVAGTIRFNKNGGRPMTSFLKRTAAVAVLTAALGVAEHEEN